MFLNDSLLLIDYEYSFELILNLIFCQTRRIRSSTSGTKVGAVLGAIATPQTTKTRDTLLSITTVKTQSLWYRTNKTWDIGIHMSNVLGRERENEPSGARAKQPVQRKRVSNVSERTSVWFRSSWIRDISNGPLTHLLTRSLARSLTRSWARGTVAWFCTVFKVSWITIEWPSF